MSLTKKIIRSLEFDFSFSFKNVKEDYFGIQTGVTTRAHNLKGLQASLLNIAKSGTLIQLGIENRAGELETSSNEETNGFQIALMRNHAEILNGLQFAPVNSADEINGLQLGGINSAAICEGAAQVALGLNIALHADTQCASLNYCIHLEEAEQYGAVNLAMNGDDGIQGGMVNLLKKGEKTWQFGGLNIILSNPWYAKVTPLVNYAVDMESYRKKQKLKLEKEVSKIKESKKEGNGGIVYARF